MAPGVDVEFHRCAQTFSDYSNRWIGNTFQTTATGGSGVKPAEECIFFAGNLHGQTTEQFNKELKDACSTLRWMLPPMCTDEVQAVDAG